MRKCQKCGQETALSDFYADKRKSDGLQTECKPCVRERSRLHYQANREVGKAKRRAYYAANRDRQREVMREWYQQNKDRAHELSQRWRAANPDRKRDMEMDRRARVGGYLDETVDRLVVLERGQGICGICEQPVDPNKFDVDHILAISNGGRHNYENCQPAHPACNQGKRNKLMHEYAAKRRAAVAADSPASAPSAPAA